MAEEAADQDQDTGTPELSDEELWEQDEAGETESEEEADTSEEEPAEEEDEEEVEYEEDDDEPEHDYEQRYKSLEKEFHRRNEDTARLREEFNDMRLKMLEQQQELSKAKAGQTQSTVVDPSDEKSWFDDEDRQTMSEFGELTGVMQKMIQHEMAKQGKVVGETTQQAQERIAMVEQSLQNQQQQQYLQNHEAYMRAEVGDDYRDIDRDADFQSFVLASPALTKMMTESFDPVDHASVMNLWLDTQKSESKLKPQDTGKQEARRRAASGLAKNTAPQRTKSVENMSDTELWDSIPD